MGGPEQSYILTELILKTLAQNRAKKFANFYISRYGKDALQQATLRIAGLGINPSKDDRLMWRDVISEINAHQPLRQLQSAHTNAR